MAGPGGSRERRVERPFVERWWWYFLVTGWAWFRMPQLVHDLANGKDVGGFGWTALAPIALMLPLFIWTRWREARKRSTIASDTAR